MYNKAEHFDEYFKDIIACLDLLDSFEKGDVDLFDFEYKICIAASNAGCLYADVPMQTFINDLFEREETFDVDFTTKERIEFVKNFFPDFKAEIKKAFEERIQFQISEIKPILLKVINESWIYCSHCLDGFDAEEGDVFFVKLCYEKSFFVFCPKCFLIMKSEVDLLENLNPSQHYFGIFFNEKRLEILAKL